MVGMRSPGKDALSYMYEFPMLGHVVGNICELTEMRNGKNYLLGASMNEREKKWNIIVY